MTISWKTPSRIGRRWFAADVSVLAASMFLLVVPSFFVPAESPSNAFAVVLSLACLSMAVLLLGLLSSRLHDFGRSGWWAFAVQIVAVLGFVGNALRRRGDDDLEMQDVDWVLSGMFWNGLIVLALGVFVLVLIPGSGGTNRWGPPPTKGAWRLNPDVEGRRENQGRGTDPEREWR